MLLEFYPCLWITFGIYGRYFREKLVPGGCGKPQLKDVEIKGYSLTVMLQRTERNSTQRNYKQKLLSTGGYRG
jgi:hypothetical protein